ncbi:urease subunit alpha [Thiorhodovibrio frisius]|uniref:Urease subunit alpha n=1 Tax=Thiorhodovibrio frisius TaxID=631362 RepID=H8Z546_9GAMM|nr:urease subunit alpha [Thiorhodovibrio frisius]EIC20453.1 urea amidohydrolase (urease) alpha subunit [Thiorhodovibrio frisius]WPL21197.1 Urease subunit alpha [Thiorhodovibrio frisius]
MSKISRAEYAALYGPTIGDRVRLGDTNLVAQIEEDLTHYGDEVRFGRGGSIRDGMGQCQRQADLVMDTVITNALVIDFWGVIKADIGLKDGRIAAIGKAGNPNIQTGADVIIGPGTDIIAGEGHILTAGGVDAMTHFISPAQAEVALMAGVTTLIGGGTGPSAGSLAAPSTPGPWNIRRMLQAAEGLPVNIGILAKGSGSLPNPLEEQVRSGAMGLMLHPAWGCAPAAIARAVEIVDKMDVQLLLQPDTLNEAGTVAELLAVVGERCVSTLHGQRDYQGRDYHGAEEALQALGLTHALPLSVLSPPVSGMGQATRVGALEMLHDLGAISVVASGGQGGGRIGDLIRRTWQMAHSMKVRRGHLAPPPFAADIDREDNDNYRIKRYIAKYGINPAINHGIAHEVGSVEVGKLADLVLWRPAFFGVRPSLVLKGGLIAAAPLGDAGASVPDAQPLQYAPMFGVTGAAAPMTCMTFVSQWAFQAGEPQRLDLARRIGVARDVRQLRKIDMIHNFWQPAIEVDARGTQVHADGMLMACELLPDVPLGQRYALF